MASYQRDFKQTAKDSYQIINDYKASLAYRQSIDGQNYFNGDNTTISNIRRWYWKDERDETGKVIGGGFTPNYYVANNKISFGFFKDMVTQKVDTLFRETPTIQTNYEIDKRFIKEYGYALKIGADMASQGGYSLLFLDANNNISVLSSANTVVFYDDDDGSIKAVIYFYEIKGIRDKELRWYIFTNEGVTAYTENKGQPKALTDTPQKYKYKTAKSYLTNAVINEVSSLPIVEFDNNRLKVNDLSNNIRSKIDIIDLVQSGFANNIEDFSDAYWVIKDTMGLSETYYQDFLANINRTKKIVGEGAEMKQFQIPTEARSKFVEIIKQDLIQDGGVLDIKAMTSGNLTATAIMAARANLETRVSNFEWQAYKAANELIDVYQQMNGLNFEYDISFNKYTLNNTSEAIQNAVMLYGKVSDDTFLGILKDADIIDDVETEKERMADEALSKYGAGGGINDDDGAQ